MFQDFSKLVDNGNCRHEIPVVNLMMNCSHYNQTFSLLNDVFFNYPFIVL